MKDTAPDSSETDSIRFLTQRIQEFVAEREWRPFHSPKEMSVAIVAEASELLQHFVWKSPGQSEQIVCQRRDSVADEIADIAILLLELADNLGLSLGEIVCRKLHQNESRYPADLVRGTNLKYNELSRPSDPAK